MNGRLKPFQPWVSENAAHVKSFEPCLTGVGYIPANG